MCSLNKQSYRYGKENVFSYAAHSSVDSFLLLLPLRVGEGVRV